eukprot:scaffold11899_cov133-Isochrysis_galbana.AAC.5
MLVPPHTPPTFTATPPPPSSSPPSATDDSDETQPPFYPPVIDTPPMPSGVGKKATLEERAMEHYSLEIQQLPFDPKGLPPPLQTHHTPTDWHQQ